MVNSMKIIVPAEKLAAAVNKYVIPAIVRKQLADQKKEKLDKCRDEVKEE
jgi:hypothetical protein